MRRILLPLLMAFAGCLLLVSSALAQQGTASVRGVCAGISTS